MRQYLFLAFAFLVVCSCGKDKLDTKPSIKIKSVSSEFVPNGFGLSVEMEFADKEGDISNTLFVQKIRTNIKPAATIRDTFSLIVPEFTVTQRGKIKVNLTYQNHLISAITPPGTPPNFDDDTLILRFVLRDLAGNVSDTANAGTIIVER